MLNFIQNICFLLWFFLKILGRRAGNANDQLINGLYHILDLSYQGPGLIEYLRIAKQIICII
ncbi:hypothetical protein CK934_17720 [Chitinophaga sp. MD30]|nr:hypothetical protein CK934_17720 [Chitinophaga sp. MD30]